MARAKQWFVEHAGRETGPYPIADLQQMAASGRLQPYDRLRVGSSRQWRLAGNVPGIFPHTNRPSVVERKLAVPRWVKPVTVTVVTVIVGVVIFRSGVVDRLATVVRELAHLDAGGAQPSAGQPATREAPPPVALPHEPDPVEATGDGTLDLLLEISAIDDAFREVHDGELRLPLTPAQAAGLRQRAGRIRASLDRLQLRADPELVAFVREVLAFDEEVLGMSTDAMIASEPSVSGDPFGRYHSVRQQRVIERWASLEEPLLARHPEIEPELRRLLGLPPPAAEPIDNLARDPVGDANGDATLAYLDAVWFTPEADGGRQPTTACSWFLHSGAVVPSSESAFERWVARARAQPTTGVDGDVIDRMRALLPLLTTLEGLQTSVAWELGGHRDVRREAFAEGQAWIALLSRMRFRYPEQTETFEQMWDELPPCRLVAHGE